MSESEEPIVRRFIPGLYEIREMSTLTSSDLGKKVCIISETTVYGGDLTGYSTDGDDWKGSIYVSAEMEEGKSYRTRTQSRQESLDKMLYIAK